MLSNTVQLATVLAVSLVATAAAQDLGGLPACAQNCLATALVSNGKACAATDFACLCKNADFVSSSSKCYKDSCTAADLVTAQQWGVKSCAAAGVKIAKDGAEDAAGAVATGATNAAGAAANGVANAANGVANAANGTATAIAGNKTTTTGATAAPAPANGTAPNNKPDSAAAPSSETLKVFAAVSALASSLFMI